MKPFIKCDFANISSANIKLLKTQLSKMVQLGGILFSVLPFWANPEEAIEKIDQKWMENKIALISVLNKADKI